MQRFRLDWISTAWMFDLNLNRPRAVQSVHSYKSRNTGPGADSSPRAISVAKHQERLLKHLP